MSEVLTEWYRRTTYRMLDLHRDTRASLDRGTIGRRFHGHELRNGNCDQKRDRRDNVEESHCSSGCPEVEVVMPEH